MGYNMYFFAHKSGSWVGGGRGSALCCGLGSFLAHMSLILGPLGIQEMHFPWPMEDAPKEGERSVSPKTTAHQRHSHFLPHSIPKQVIQANPQAQDGRVYFTHDGRRQRWGRKESRKEGAQRVVFPEHVAIEALRANNLIHTCAVERALNDVSFWTLLLNIEYVSFWNFEHSNVWTFQFSNSSFFPFWNIVIFSS